MQYDNQDGKGSKENNKENASPVRDMPYKQDKMPDRDMGGMSAGTTDYPKLSPTITQIVVVIM